MPLYDFKCPRCSTLRVDVIVQLDELAYTDMTAPCPNCGAKLERMPATFTFVIKGYSAKNGYSS